MPLALPFDGGAPLLLHVVFHPFERGPTSGERTVWGKSFARRGEGPLWIAPSPMAVLLQPCVGAVHEFPTACLGRHAADRACALGLDPADVVAAQHLQGPGLPAVGGRARGPTVQRATSVSCPVPTAVPTSPCGGCVGGRRARRRASTATRRRNRPQRASERLRLAYLSGLASHTRGRARSADRHWRGMAKAGRRAGSRLPASR
jgi:hypothetical protein